MRPALQVAKVDQMARALVEANGSVEAKGVVLAVSWVVGAWSAPLTGRAKRAPVTRGEAREESWLALCEAAGEPPSEQELGKLGLVRQQAATSDDAERAYGIWRTLSWLLGTYPDPPVEVPERLADGTLADSEPRYTLREGSAVWETTQSHRREQHRAEALRWWRRGRGAAETAGSS